MKWASVALILAVGCATAPAAKVPDEKHRVPVNRTVPPEVKGDGGVDDERGPRR